MRGNHLTGIPTVTQHDFLIMSQSSPGHSQKGRFGPGLELGKTRRQRGGRGGQDRRRRPPRLRLHPVPSPNSQAEPGRPTQEASRSPCTAGSENARGGRHGLSAVRRAPGNIYSMRAFPQVTSNRSSPTPSYQPPRTPGARKFVRGAHARATSMRFRGDSLGTRFRRGHPNAHVQQLPSDWETRRGLFTLVPLVLNPYPPLAWCEKLFSAIFSVFVFFPYPLSPLHVLPLNSIYILCLCRLSL